MMMVMMSMVMMRMVMRMTTADQEDAISTNRTEIQLKKKKKYAKEA